MKQQHSRSMRANSLPDRFVEWRAGLPSRSAGALSDRRWQLARRVVMDLLVIPFCLYLALEIRFEGNITDERLRSLWLYAGPIIVVYVAMNWGLGNYRRKWAYANFEASWLIVETVGVATAVLLLLNFLLRALTPISTSATFEVMPTSVIIITGLLVLIASTGLRYRTHLWAWFVSHQLQAKKNPQERAVIVGTNETVLQLLGKLSTRHEGSTLDIVGFVDDDVGIQGMNINGCPVLGRLSDIREIVRSHCVDVIIMAEPVTTREHVWAIGQACQDISVQIKVLPNLTELMDCDYHHPLTLEDVSFDDLLNRSSARMDRQACQAIVRAKTVMVTGAAGSIGAELCRQICSLEPTVLLALDNNETGLFDLHRCLRKMYGALAIVPIIADVTDRAKIGRVFGQHRPQVVFHAAAYKHVPLAEAFPDEAVRVNILGTIVVSEAAHQHGTERFVFISTDKAVDPVGVMGASKRICELWVAALAQRSRTVFTAVRFGNVIGSRGSVFPIFRQQIDEGGPVTITHPAMQRFFMSIPEAVALVLEAGAMGSGSEVFMLDMGSEIRIQELAERMIRLKGLRVQTDIPIEYVGVRPGEKLSERLSYEFERRQSTAHPRIFSLEAGGQAVDQQALGQAIRDLVKSLDEPVLDGDLGARIVAAATADYGLDHASPAGHGARKKPGQSEAPDNLNPLPAWR